MWRRAYLSLTLLRLYFALCPSYLHPDENFQGPEVIAGHVFGYPVHQTWEFTTETPIRSAFPLWLVYGWPMTILKWISEGSGHGQVRPSVVFWTLRALMFALSFVLEDWAIHELIENLRQRRQAILLIASSYVTWTWQVHTFSNSLETIVLIWSLVLLHRVREHQGPHASLTTPAALGFLLVFGVFNRITFPAFVVIPLINALPALLKRKSHTLTFAACGLLTTALAILVDTEFYAASNPSFLDAVRHPTITPLNNLRYNSNSTNLAQHGTHPLYQHFLANIPQLLGPALPLLLYNSYEKSSTNSVASMQVITALAGTIILSVFPHQEARFLLPAVPLLLMSLHLPANRKAFQIFISTWIGFNVVFGLLMGVYHQAGVFPAQMWLENQTTEILPNDSSIFWWRTYSPPTWLLNGRNNDVHTIDLMGLPKEQLEGRICHEGAGPSRLLVVPKSTTYLDQFQLELDISNNVKNDMFLTREMWSTRRHLNLDDVDFGDDGVIPTLKRVIGRRGLSIWKVECSIWNPELGRRVAI